MERVKNVKIKYGNPTNPMSKLERITAGQKYFLSSNELKLKVNHLFHKKIVQVGLKFENYEQFRDFRGKKIGAGKNSKITSTSETKRSERVKILKSRAAPRQIDRSGQWGKIL